MPVARPADGAPRRRGPRPRHTRRDVALAAVAIADADGMDKVTFRAVVSLQFPVRDARPIDNEVIAISTTVLPSLTDLRFA